MGSVWPQITGPMRGTNGSGTSRGLVRLEVGIRIGKDTAVDGVFLCVDGL
jgi:hypothetical protein